MTTNGTEAQNVQYKTSDGFVFRNYDEAVAHNVVNSRYTNAGSHIEIIHDDYHPFYY